MSDPSLWNEVVTTVGQYVSDEIMLDALLQWATNPTSASAGYGLEENYPFIAKNLASRYGLTRQEADKRVGQLRDVCHSLKESAEKLSTEPRSQVGEIQRALLGALTQASPQQQLRHGVLRRLRRVSNETRRALLVFSLLEEEGSTISANDLTRPADFYSDRQSEFQAYCKSIFGEMVPSVQVLDEIVRCGSYNELYWVPSPSAKSSPGPTLVKAIVPTIGEVEVIGTKLPPAPDIPHLLESHWQNGDFDLLRLIDIVSHSYGGVSTIDEPLPVGTEAPGFLGCHGHTVALSPVILAATRQHVDVIKSQRMEESRRHVERVLVTTARRIGADASLGVLWTGMGEVLWKFELLNSPPFYVYLAPWLTTLAQSPGLSRVGVHYEKLHVLFIIPCQSRPSLLRSLERYSGFSPKDTRWEKSLGLLTDLKTPSEFQLLIGQRHPLLDQILEALSSGEGPAPLPPVKHRLEVEVTDGAGAPISNAQVCLGTTSLCTGQDGRIIFEEVLGGEYELTASADGYELVSKKILVTKDEQEAVSLIRKTSPGRVIRIGSVDDHQQDGVLGRTDGQDVLLDLYEPHAITILGVQASGKSYTAGAIIEMAVRHITNVSVLGMPLSCIILHFSKEERRIPEWIGLAEQNSDESQIQKLETVYGVSPTAIDRDRINILVPPTVVDRRKEEYAGFNVMPLLFSPSKLRADDWKRLLTFGKGTDALYMEALRELMIDLRDKKADFGVDDLTDEIKRSELNASQRRFALQRIKTVGRWLSEKAHPFVELLNPGVVNIVDLRDPLAVDEKMAALVLQTVFAFVKDRPSLGICLVAIDEAHLFLEHENLTQEIVEFVALLRKDYKVYLLLISQQPRRFHPDILALSDMIVCHRLESDLELDFLRRNKPKFSDATETIKKLRTKQGEAFMWARISTDDIFAQPKLISVRPKCTEDRGRTSTAF